MSMNIASKKPFDVKRAVHQLGKTLKRLGFNFVLMYYRKEHEKQDLEGSFSVETTNPAELAAFMLSMAAHDENWKLAIQHTYEQINQAVLIQAKQESQKGK